MDQSKALSYVQLESQRCPNCGEFPDDWIDPETGQAVEPPPKMAVAHKCYACVDLHDAREMVPDHVVGISHFFAPWEGRLDPYEDE